MFLSLKQFPAAAYKRKAAARKHKLRRRPIKVCETE